MDDHVFNLSNDDNALMRFEFFRAITFVAHAKFVRTGLADDVADGLDHLIQDHFAKHGPPEGRIDPDEFRRRRLYTSDAHTVLECHLSSLYQYFRVYADTPQPRDTARYLVDEYEMAAAEDDESACSR